MKLRSEAAKEKEVKETGAKLSMGETHVENQPTVTGMAAELGQAAGGQIGRIDNHGDDTDIRHLLIRLESKIEHQKIDIYEKLEEVNISIKKEISEVVKGETEKILKYVDSELSLVHGKIDKVEAKVYEMESKIINEFDPDVTIVATGVRPESDENPMRVADDIVRQGLRLYNVNIVRAARVPGKQGSAGILKIEMPNVQEKIRVLQSKQNLQNSSRWNRVFLRSSKTHAERVNEMNMKTLLSMIPGGDKKMVSGNGKIIDKNFWNRNQIQIQGSSSGTDRPFESRRNDRPSGTQNMTFSFDRNFSQVPRGDALLYNLTNVNKNMSSCPLNVVQIPEYSSV